MGVIEQLSRQQAASLTSAAVPPPQCDVPDLGRAAGLVAGSAVAEAEAQRCGRDVRGNEWLEAIG
jgi:hypothetical protein